MSREELCDESTSDVEEADDEIASDEELDSADELEEDDSIDDELLDDELEPILVITSFQMKKLMPFETKMSRLPLSPPPVHNLPAPDFCQLLSF